MTRWKTVWILVFFGWWLNLETTLAQTSAFVPTQQIEALRKAQQHYQTLANSNKWVPINEAVCLVACEKAPEITGLKNNLQLTGDLPAHASEQDSLFDDALVEAVKKFQRRHGLVDDGVIGPQTLAALNVTPAQRLAQIELNLQRWQLALAQPAQRMVFVNLPDFTLHLLDSTGRAVWQTRVVIGQTGKDYQTIPMESQLSHLVLNPTWTVPQSILNREIIPMLKSDPSYLSRNNMLVYRVDGNKRVQVAGRELLANPTEVARERYWVVQQPGLDNSLGNIKFMFPNPHDIYLHDTPARSLFEHPVRAYSHGCVRVEDPEMLGAYLLSQDWAAPSLPFHQLQDYEPNKTVKLPEPISVKLTYYTSWVDDAGQLQFRKDLYGLDKQEKKEFQAYQLPNGFKK